MDTEVNRRKLDVNVKKLFKIKRKKQAEAEKENNTDKKIEFTPDFVFMEEIDEIYIKEE